MNRSRMSSLRIGWAGWLSLAVVLFICPAAQGTYDPHHGRWFQRDPLGVRPDAPDGDLDQTKQSSDGLNFYQYARNCVTSNTDPDGLITVERVSGSKKSTCGSFTYRWRFRLPKRAPCPGFLVQHVRFKAVCPDCKTSLGDYLNSLGPKVKVVEYWEQFPLVPKGARDVAIDEAYSPSLPCRSGLIEQEGESRFFCATDADPPIPASPRVVGSSTCDDRRATISSGDFLHTTSPPPWWNNNRQDMGTGYRVASSSWDCCCKPFVSNSGASP